MKYIYITIISVFLFSAEIFSQNLDATLNGQTITGCNTVTLYDDGGPGGQYTSNTDYSVTLCSGNGDCMEVSFTSIDMEAGYDYINIYDGNSTSAPQLAHLSGNTIPANVTSSASAGGCITIQITSDGIIQHDGFELNVNCTSNCYVPPPPPTNNDPCSALALTVDLVCNSITATTLGATNSTVPIPSCAFNYNGGDVWFSAVVPASGFLEVDLTPTSPGLSDAGITIYTGADCNNLTEYACNDPWGGIPPAQYVMGSSGLAGQTVWIRVWELGNDNQGAFDICALEPPAFFEANPNTYTPEELVEDILVTGCLEAENTVYTGSPDGVGYFTNGGITGFESGVVMGSGPVVTVAGTSTADDNLNYDTPLINVQNDLSSISQQNGGSSDMNDVSTLEFDFVPSSELTEFEFVFASEEYNAFECTIYNDVFAFFLSGPGIVGPYNNNSINVALIPGTTTPITISTVNGPNVMAPCGGSNSQYYIDHPDAGVDFQVRGYTTPLTAALTNLTPCETYHITLAIADAGDGSLNSFVFFNEASFSSGGEVSMSNASPVGTVNDIYEGCQNYWVYSRIDTSETALLDTIFIDLNISGTATQNVDYTTSSTNMVILPGQMTDTLFYDAIWDNVQEGSEYIVFNLLNGCPCSLESTSDTIWILDNFDLNPIISNDTVICGDVQVTVSVDINPLQDGSIVEYLWDDGSNGTSITVSPNTTETHWVNVSTPCQQDTTVEMTISIGHPDPTFALSKDSICLGEDITVTYTGITTPTTAYTWDFDSGTPATANTEGPHTVNWNSAGIKNVTLSVNDNGCEGDTLRTVFVSPNPNISITETNNLCFGNCNGELLAQPQDNLTPYIFLWSNNQNSNPATGLCAGSYSVNFLNRFGCLSNANATITQPSQLTFILDSTAVQCFGGHNGSASITVTSGVPPYTYSWTGPNGFTDNTQNPSGLYTGIYNVTATDNNGCEVIGSLSISQPNTTLTSNIEPINITCFGASDGTVLLHPTGGLPTYTFLWSNGVVTQNLIHSPPGTYDVTITDANGCIGYNSATLTEPTELINNSITTVNNTCWNENNGSATINISGGVPPYNYTWSNGISGSQTANSLLSGTYSVTVSDANNCQLIINNIEITEPGKLNVAFNNLPTMCIGQSEDLISSVSGGTTPYVYQWNTGIVNNTITISPTDTAVYSLTVTDANNCVATASKTINVYGPISITLVADKYKVCPGDPVLLTTTVTGGNGNFTYTLNTDENISDLFTVYPNADISYSVTVNDNCGSPSGTAQINVQTYPIPSLSFSSDVLKGCQPLTVHFNEQSDNNSIISYNWNFGDNYSGYGEYPIHVYEDWGVFDVSLEITSSDGCKNSSKINNMIESFKKPIAKFSAKPQTASMIKPEIRFYNLSEDNYINYWEFGDGQFSSIVNPAHKYLPVPAVYDVKLRVETEHNCVDSSYTEITIVNEYTMFVPSAFSPDGDEINDSFFAVGNGVDLDVFKLIVYDRWGEIIWQTNDMSKGWNGKTKSGKYVQTGIFKWVLTYQDELGIEYQKSGTVNVIR